MLLFIFRVDNQRKRTTAKGKPGTKMVVRNIPFQATQNEVRELFKVFGEIKAMRLPKKMVGTGTHRGFCFIEYQSIHDAKVRKVLFFNLICGGKSNYTAK